MNVTGSGSFDARRLVIELRRWADGIRRREMERARRRLGGFTREQAEVIDAATSVIVSKLLHTPAVQIRQLARDGHGAEVIGLVRRVLGAVL